MLGPAYRLHRAQLQEELRPGWRASVSLLLSLRNVFICSPWFARGLSREASLHVLLLLAARRFYYLAVFIYDARLSHV